MLLFPALVAQEKPPAFEVASIKPVDQNVEHMQGVQVFPGGRVVISALSLKMLITTAYHLAYRDISGGEPWMEKEEYRIEAVPPPEWRTKITNLKHGVSDIEDEHLRQMLQALLIDRFQLKVRRETKTGTVYLLKRGGKTLRLRPAQVSENSGAPSPFGSVGYVGAKWSIFDTTMPQLAKFAGDNVIHAKVIDQTGLEGQFDYRQAEPDLDPNYSDPSPSFSSFLSEAGLKLERTQGEIAILIIESAAKPTN